jgi:hypothetical protein
MTYVMPGAGAPQAGGLARAASRLRGWLPMVPPAALTRPVDRVAAWRAVASAVRGVERTTADLLVVRLADGVRRPVALKSPRSPRAAAALAREHAVLRTLTADERLGDWRALLPRPDTPEDGEPSPLGPPLPLTATPPAPRRPYAQSWLPGTTAAALLTRRPELADRAARTALDALVTLQRVTGKQVPAEPYLDEWVEPALAVLRDEVAWCRTAPGAAALAALRERLREGLAGRTLTVGWTHGDYHPGNVLLTPDAARATGVIDWVQARPEGPLATDALLYVLAQRRLLSGAELGSCLVGIVERGGLPAEDLRLLDELGLPAEETGATDAALPLLAWLWHIAGNAAKSARYGRSHRWVARNVIPVLRASSR